MAPPGLSRVWGFQGRSLFFEALTMSGVLLSTWFCVLRHSRPLATCLPACHLLPTPEPARPAPHPIPAAPWGLPPDAIFQAGFRWLTPVSLPPEPACEDADEDEDEDDYHNPGYLVVLPDSTPAASTAAPSATALSTPGLRDSAFSMESIDDYVNVPESGESAEASLDGSREYVNVSQELHPGAAKTEPAALSSQKAEEVEEEGAPDYENLQELN
ncbi:linker for activation of T-cells family member 1 isoform X8 [Macaca mulatta]